MRIARATTDGGLGTLPVDFGDPDGGWTTIRDTENPFAVLYLDHRQADRITPEITSRHRDLIQRFWQEKLRSMSQGAARVAILRKYGGPDESEKLVRSYPDAIEHAYQQLATRSGIRDASSALRARRDAALFERVDNKLDDYLVDSVLQPDELRALLAFSEREGLERAAVLQRVRERLDARGYVGECEASGTTIEEQLLSTAWVHPSRIRSAETPQGVVPHKRSLLLPLLLFSFVVVVVLLAAAAIRTSQVDEPVVVPRHVKATTPVPPVLPPVAPQTTAPQPQVPAPVVRHDDAPSAPAATDTRESAERLADRERVTESVAQLRGAMTSDPDAALKQVSELEKTIRADDADSRLAVAGLRSDIEKLLLTRELERQKTAAEETAAKAMREQRDREWQQRIAQIEELMRQPNYSGAKALADRVAADPDAPPQIAQRARELGQQAVTELQKIFSNTTIKSKTSRPSPERP